jgi:hypothetical protein
MVTIRLNAILKPNGQLDYELPAELPEDDFELVLDVKHAAETSEEDDDDISPEEMLNFKGLTAGEILASGLVGQGADWDIGDSAEWVEKQREKRRQERLNRWKSL